ncbi:MAG: ATP-binding protein [Magnetococcales bacterium]|nr:ATP-binding protein [Magnetococcales bacterium]
MIGTEDGSQVPPASGLTPELLKEICPVARSDRRLHPDLFKGLLSEEDTKDDRHFYAALLDRIRTDRIFFQKFNDLFEKKDRKKCFLLRARRWLARKLDEDVMDRATRWLFNVDMDVIPLDEDRFPFFSPQREVMELCKMLVSDIPNHSISAPPTTPPLVPPNAPVEPADWQSVRDRLLDMVKALDAPDPDQVKAIRVEVDLLFEACAIAEQRMTEAEQANLNFLRMDLTNQMIPLREFAEGAALLDRIDTADREFLEVLMEAIPPILDLHMTFANASRIVARTQAAYDDALQTKDRRLIRERDSEVENAEASRAKADSELREALANALELFVDAIPVEAAQQEPVALPAESRSIPLVQDSIMLEEIPSTPDSIVSEKVPIISDTTILEEVPGTLLEEAVPVESDAVLSSQPISEADAEPVYSMTTFPVFAKASVTQPFTITGVTKGIGSSPSAIWDGEQPLDELLARYLDAGEYAIAFHLADLSEENGFLSPLPSAVLKALAVMPTVSGQWDIVTQGIDEVLANAMTALETVEQEGDEGKIERVRAVFFSSLLRPAFLVPDSSSARLHLKNLPLRGDLAAYSSLHKALIGLIYDFHPTLAELGELAGVERERRLPRAKKSLCIWQEQAESAHHTHAPTHHILHQLVAPQGEVGRVIVAALEESPESDSLAEHLIQNLAGNRLAIERLIAKCEQEKGRPQKDKIRGMALDWVCRKLQEGCERVQDWLEAFQADRLLLNDNRRQTLQRQIGPLKKALAEIDTFSNTGRQGIDGSVARIIQNAIRALHRLIEGESGGVIQRLHEALDLPLLRLPSGCQLHLPRPDDPAYAEEREAQRMRLFNTLKKPESLAVEEEKAFWLRLEEHAILPANRLMERLTQCEWDEAAAEQALNEATNTARHQAQSDVRGLRLELATLYNLDLGTGDAVRKWLDRLDAINSALTEPSHDMEPHVRIPTENHQRSPNIPPDFPELGIVLDEIRAFRDDLRRRILENQHIRLDELKREKPALSDDIRALDETIERRDPVTVEDMIAQLQAGLPLTGLDTFEEDPFTAFFPGFVDEVANATSDTLNRPKIDAALNEGKRIGSLDFSGLDDHARTGARQLLEYWRRTENAMKTLSEKTPGDLKNALRILMETIGFTSVEISNENQLIPERLRRFQMRADPLVARWFLPPVFGSEAGGVYPLFLSNPVVPDDQLSTELGKAGRESPCLLLVFGKLSRQRREAFVRRMHRTKQSVLLIDETQILYLVTDSHDRMERLFACAAPFGYLQPYTTNSGNIPREMFFGRGEEIEKIMSRQSDGCLVYGGRQLGKSALLQHVRKLYDDQKGGTRAIYLKIDVIGAHGTPTARIWDEIDNALVSEGVSDKRQLKADAVISMVRSWLGADPARRILILLDETDAFFAAESRAGFPNLGRLKDLMEETERRFKVVFAGLHNVRRMAQAPNSPLVHLGNPICIGPLNTTTSSKAAARRLVTAPMRAAGFDYETPEFAWDILARVNHYPSLVQVFCKALLEGLSNQSNQSRPAGRGPRWPLTREQIFEGGSAQEINRQIRERFQWTLNLDPRYELIAKVLALFRLEQSSGDAAVLREGLTVKQIAIETGRWWPAEIEQLGLEDFRSLLDEMVDLGVFARYGKQQDRFGLRSAQVAQMLGRQDEIEEQILQISSKEPKVDYDAAHFCRRVTLDDPISRSPLVDRALADLFDFDRPGLRIFVAAPALWGGKTAQHLLGLADQWTDDKGRCSARPHYEAVPKLRDLFERQRGKQRTVVVLAEKMWNNNEIEWVAQQTTVRSGDVLPIFMASPAWLSHYRLESERAIPASIVTPQPWGETMLRVWLEERELGQLDTRPLRQRLLAGTGGVPVLLEGVYPLLRDVVSDIASEERVTRWVEEQRLSPKDVGLLENLALYFHGMADLIGDQPEDFSTINDTMNELFAPPAHGSGLDLKKLLALWADLGLVRHDDLMRDKVEISPLGLLVARTMVKS